MSYRINPDHVCGMPGCIRPKATGEDICSRCSRLARAVGRDRPDYSGRVENMAAEVGWTAEEGLVVDGKAPRCIAYLSQARDVIVLELTGEPAFTEADVEAVAAALSNRKKAS